LIPNFSIVRPGDANETAIAWREIITRDKPVGIALSRQNLPVFDRTECGSAEGVAKGAYVIVEAKSEPDVILIATGSEVHVAIAAAKILSDQNIAARVVSAPCLEWFEEQPDSYKESILPKSVKARVSVEAGVGAGWHKYVGDKGEIVSLEHFGASASAGTLFKEYGFTPENVAEAAKRTIARS
jgi:transketolase